MLPSNVVQKNARRYYRKIDTDIPVPTREISYLFGHVSFTIRRRFARFTNLLTNREDKRDKVL